MATTTRERRRDATRHEIVQTAWRLAERNGVAAISLREVAREVGLQAPSLYTYFDGKAAIYDAMFVEGYLALGKRMAEVELDPDDLVGSLATAIDRFVAFAQESLPRYQLMFTAAVPDWSVSEPAYSVSVEQYGRIAARLSGVGITEQGDLDLLIALMSGLAAQQLANEPGGGRWQRLAGDAAAMFVTHVQRRRR